MIPTFVLFGGTFPHGWPMMREHPERRWRRWRRRDARTALALALVVVARCASSTLFISLLLARLRAPPHSTLSQRTRSWLRARRTIAAAVEHMVPPLLRVDRSRYVRKAVVGALRQRCGGAAEVAVRRLRAKRRVLQLLSVDGPRGEARRLRKGADSGAVGRRTDERSMARLPNHGWMQTLRR